MTAAAKNEKQEYKLTSATLFGSHSNNDFHCVHREDTLLSDDILQPIAGYDAALMRARATLSTLEEHRLLRRIDWRLLPLLAAMFVVKSIDASNLSNALIIDRGTARNVLEELHMTQDQYNLVTTMYYVPYIVAEVPSNLILKHLKPSVWQARIMVSWGIVLCCHTAVKDRQGLYTVRFLLGLFEAGLWPGILLQLCYWYRPDEIASRIIIIVAPGIFSSVISGVLAFGFNGVYAAGLSGWKWLVLSEGMFTVLLGIFVLFFLPNFPATVSWLSEKEKAFIQARLPSNSPRASELDFDLRELIKTLKDERLWLFLLCWAFYTIGTTGLEFYQPTVIANLGFTSIGKAQLLNIPSAVLGVVLCVIFGIIIPDTGRIPQPLLPLIILVILEGCYVALYMFPSTGGVYAATIVAGGFSLTWYIVMWPWRVQTTSGATGSAFAIAIANSYGQIGAAVRSQLFNRRYAPHYTTSFGIAMGFIGMAIVMNLITWRATWKVDVETRRLLRARMLAGTRNEAVLEDVNIELGKNRKQRRMDRSFDKRRGTGIAHQTI